MLRNHKILQGVVIFLSAYPLLLFLWIHVKPYYGLIVAELGTRPAAALMGVGVEELRQTEEITKVTFVCPVLVRNSIQEMLIDLEVPVSTYSFNVPLTLALTLALWPMLRWGSRALIEVLVILVAIHTLYVLSFCALQLCRQLVTSGIELYSRFTQFSLEFLWQFTDNMIIRFEPFLVAVYLWLRRPRSGRLPQWKTRPQPRS